MIHMMSKATATIRELRTNFRQVKRKVEEYGAVTITDRGEPAFVLQPVQRAPRKPVSMPDYYARLVRRQPKAMSAKETRGFWEEERGDC